MIRDIQHREKGTGITAGEVPEQTADIGSGSTPDPPTDADDGENQAKMAAHENVRRNCGNQGGGCAVSDPEA